MTSCNTNRDELLYSAMIAEKAERFHEMMSTMKTLAKMNKGLNLQERILFSVAYKNGISVKRQSWRTIRAIEQNETSEARLAIIQRFRLVIENEIEIICADVIKIIDECLLLILESSEAQVFYLKMKGDYYRYLAEIANNNSRQEMAENACAAYKEATELAVTKLSPTSPVRLGLALNFSVFFYDILTETARACRIAKAAFDDAVAELDTLPEDSYREATLIMQLLRDNLSFWTGDSSHEDTAHDVPENQNL